MVIYVQINLVGKKKMNFWADLCNFLGFNHTYDETCVPRKLWKKTKILDTIIKDSGHFYS